MFNLSRRSKYLALRLTLPFDHLLAKVLLDLAGDRAGILCIMLHGLVSDTKTLGYDPWRHLTLDQFRWVIRYFKSAGYCFIGLDDLDKPLEQNGHYIMLTFDDGNASDMAALKILEEEEVPSSFFISTGRLVSQEIHESNAQTPLSWVDLRVLGAHPLAHMGNHGHTHAPFPRLTMAELEREIATSQSLLSNLPRHNPGALALPSGYWNHRVMEQVKLAGFRWLFMVRPGRFRITHTHLEMAEMPRWELRGDVSLEAQCLVIRASFGIRVLIQSHFGIPSKLIQH